MANNILKEAIADAKAVREVALANAKAALEEAFTPRLQSMLSAKLSETLNEEDEEELDEMVDMDEEDTIDEADTDEKDTVDEMAMYDEDDVEENLDEEIDLEEILSELELDEAKDEDKDMKEGKDEADEDMKEGKMKDADKDMKEGKDEADEDMKEGKKKEDLDEMEVNYSAETANSTGYAADYVNEENENFDLDALLEEINNLDEEKEDEVNEGDFGEAKDETDESFAGRGNVPGARGGLGSSDLHPQKGETMDDYEDRVGDDMRAAKILRAYKANPDMYQKRTMEGDMSEIEKELEETKSALETVRTELNEVNLLNSKLLYVNRIFKANNLNESQKLRVVETLDNASNVKEAKLIYETIKDTFNVAKSTKTTPKKSIREGLGMASKAAGMSTAPKKAILNE